MSLIKNKYLSSIRWRTLNRDDIQSDEPTARFIKNANMVAWTTGTIFGTGFDQPPPQQQRHQRTASKGGDDLYGDEADTPVAFAGGTNAVAAAANPTVSEYWTVNQFHAPTFGHLNAKYGTDSKAICGACSVAAAVTAAHAISELKLWDSALDLGQVEAILARCCDERRVVPLVEDVAHFIATLRANYIVSPQNQDRALRTSAAQHKRFLSEWAANFELSDCARRILALETDADVLVPPAAGAAGAPGAAVAVLAAIFGPTPFNGAVPKNLGASVPAAGLLFLRPNLWPIAAQAKHLQRQRLEAEDRQFGGREAQPGVQVYEEGEAAFFVDVLLSDELQRRQQQQQQQRNNQANTNNERPVPGGNSGKQPQSKATAAAAAATKDKRREVIDVDALDDDDDKSQREPPQERDARSPDAAVVAAAAVAAPQAVKVPPPKFLSPIQFCRALNNKESALHPPRTGPRVYVVDVIGHFVALLCYVDPTGVPHGVVINSSESRDLSSAHRPTLRLAFELYVANACAAM